VGSELDSGDSIARMAYAGHYIAYVTRFGGKYGSNESLTVEDVAMGSASTTETEAYASEYEGQPGPERLPALERLGAPLGPPGLQPRALVRRRGGMGGPQRSLPRIAQPVHPLPARPQQHP
jgi:hypothetical protein